MKKHLSFFYSLLIIFTFFYFTYAVNAENVIRIGSAISFTGKHSRSGKLYIDSYKLAVETINKKGGIRVGNKKFKLKLIFYDDKSDATESSKLIEKLIGKDKVDFLLGPYSSGITIPDSLISRRYRIPMIEGGGASGKIFTKHNKYIFGLLPKAGEYFKSTLEYLRTVKPAPESIAILYADDKFDISVGEGTKRIAEKMGFKILIFEKFSEGQSDFTSVLTKIKDRDPEVILVGGHTEEALNITQQLKELDINPKMLSLTVGPSESDFRKALGKDSDYIFGVASWSPQMKFKGFIFNNTTEFIKIFKNKFKYDPDYHNAAGIACVSVLKYAIEKAGTLDREKVREALTRSDLKTIYGTIRFNPDGQIKGTSIVLQILHGKVFEVYPDTSIRSIYPMPSWKKR